MGEALADSHVLLGPLGVASCKINKIREPSRSVSVHGEKENGPRNALYDLVCTLLDWNQ